MSEQQHEPERRIGVYVCNCGGNISDYVDVEQVVASVQDEPGVVVAKRAMFTCSDATQQQIVDDIREQSLDGMVVASCSPKLHTFTFREAARRAGLNPYQYTQVNIREQCSWTHTDDPEGATRKAIKLVRAGIGRTRLTSPLDPIVVETTPRALVIGGGVAGLRAAIGLADIGLGVVLVERAPELGGRVASLGAMYPHGTDGRKLVERLAKAVSHRDVTVFTSAEVVEKSGTFGNYRATIRVGEAAETVEVEVGSIVVATGFDSYEPASGELGYGADGVVTLPEFRRLLDADGPLVRGGKPVESIVYVYCVGSRDAERPYCSRTCCTAAVHASLLTADRAAAIRQYHLYRDMRTYGEQELLFTESRERGSLYLRVPDDEPPEVEAAADGSLTVTARDLLSGGERLAIQADLVVLVTGMVPRANEELIRTLKLPVGRDGFFNEIHPKLRPVETVVDGLLVAGACQGPKSSAESVTSALAAVTQSASVLKQGTAALDPQVAVVDAEACTWCGACAEACPFTAIERSGEVALVDAAGCKGCGGCVPVCPEDAIDLLGYTDAQIRAVIDGLAMEPVA
jgi:heterodisulfide reductase subunit A2